MREQVLLVIGVGGMGEAIARRLGSGRSVVLGDANDATLQRVTKTLESDGLKVLAQHVDVSSRASDQLLDAWGDKYGIPANASDALHSLSAAKPQAVQLSPRSQALDSSDM